MGEDGGEGQEEDARPARRVTALEALEAYSADHPETINELLEWPYRRWLKAFAAWSRRKAVAAVDRREELHITALYANTNLDSEQNDRQGMIEKLREYYQQLRELVGRDPEEVRQEREALRRMEEENPFLRAGRRNLAIVTEEPVMPGEQAIKQLA